MKSLYIMLAIAGGAIVPLQIGISRNLQEVTNGSYWHTTFVLYLGGMIASLLACLMAEGGILPPETNTTRWWMWGAGILGMFYILFMFISAPRLGVASTLVWMLFGQLVCAVILDTWGLLAMPVKSISITRILGIATILIGAFLLSMDSHR